MIVSHQLRFIMQLQSMRTEACTSYTTAVCCLTMMS